MEKDQANSVVEEITPKIENNILLQVSSRIDTTQSELKDILNLYENYINSSPDSIYDNPYWNRQEKKQFRDFDFSRRNIYKGINSRQLFQIYAPFVLSIEPVNSKYQIRVLYSSSATEPPYVGSKVWCIHQLNAIKEEGMWKLENLIVEKTKNWNKEKFDFIEFVFPAEHKFNRPRAKKALVFCKDIMNRFNPEFNHTFRFYMASDVDEMGELENFDYFFTGITTGKTMEGRILSSKGDEFYPHEFIHAILPDNISRGKAIDEGLATFLGTKEDSDEYFSVMNRLANDFNKRATYSLENLLNNQAAWNGYPTDYPAGALVCEVIYELKGDEGINRLVRGKTNNYDEIMGLIESILQLEEAEVVRLIEEKIKEFE
jgi:hypothetical protein